jgi:hypothetical protein
MYVPICCVYKTNVASSLQNPTTYNTRGWSCVCLQAPTIDKLVRSLILWKNQHHTYKFLMSVVYPKPVTGANRALSWPFSRTQVKKTGPIFQETPPVDLTDLPITWTEHATWRLRNANPANNSTMNNDTHAESTRQSSTNLDNSRTFSHARLLLTTQELSCLIG